MSKILLRTVLILTLVHTLGALALAQGTTGTILGVVYDQSQAVLPGVTITATHQGTRQQRQGLTDDQGRYALAQGHVHPPGARQGEPCVAAAVRALLASHPALTESRTE